MNTLRTYLLLSIFFSFSHQLFSNSNDDRSSPTVIQVRRVGDVPQNILSVPYSFEGSTPSINSPTNSCSPTYSDIWFRIDGIKPTDEFRVESTTFSECGADVTLELFAGNLNRLSLIASDCSPSEFCFDSFGSKRSEFVNRSGLIRLSDFSSNAFLNTTYWIRLSHPDQESIDSLGELSIIFGPSVITPVAQFNTLGGWSKSFEFNFATNFVFTRAELQATGVQIVSTNGTVTSFSNTSNWARTTPLEFSPDFSTFNFVTGPITNNPGVSPETTPGRRRGANGNTFFDNSYYVTPGTTDSILMRTFSSTAPDLNNTTGPDQPATGALFAAWAPQFIGFISGRDGQNEGQKVAATVGDVLLVRWYLNDSGTTTLDQATRQVPFELRVGNNEDQYGAGLTSSIFTPNGKNKLVGSTEYRQYVYAHASTDYYFQVAVTDDGVRDGVNDLILTLDRIDVARFDRADLTGEAVVFNQGAPTLTLASGPLGVAAPAGSIPFDTANVWRNGNGLNGFGTRVSYNPASNASLPATATRLQITIAAGSTVGNNDFALYGGGWDTVGTLISTRATGNEVISMDNDKIYFFDFWLSTPVASATVPEVRVGFTTGQVGRTVGTAATASTNVNQGRQAFLYVFTDNAPTTRLAGTNGGTALALETGSKRFTVVYEAQVDPAAVVVNPGRTTPGLDVRPAIETFGFPPVVGSRQWNYAGTINIDRVVVTSYDAPSDVATAGK